MTESFPERNKCESHNYVKKKKKFFTFVIFNIKKT